MINSLDVKKFIDTEKYQSYIKELSENYQVKMTEEELSSQGCNILAGALNDANLDLATIEKKLDSDKDFIFTFIQVTSQNFAAKCEKEGTTFLGESLTCLIYHALVTIFLDQSEKALAAHYKARKFKGHTRLAKESFAEYQEAKQICGQEQQGDACPKQPETQDFQVTSTAKGSNTAYLEYRDEQSEKFWQIDIEGCSYTVTFGRIGTKGQSKTKIFASTEECEKDAAKLIQSKKAKGYAAPGETPQPKAPAESLLQQRFALSDGYDGLVAEATLWGNAVPVVLDADELLDEYDGDEDALYDPAAVEKLFKNKIPYKKIEAVLKWIEKNRKKMIDFALDYEGFVDVFNDWVAQEIAQKGKATLYDGTVLTAETDRQAVINSIRLSGISLWVDFDDKTVSDFSIDLSTKQPDYFGGHTLTIEVDEDKEMSFGGMNG